MLKFLHKQNLKLVNTKLMKVTLVQNVLVVNESVKQATKQLCLGLFKRNGKVNTEIVPDVKAVTLQAIIRGRADISSVIHTDGWRGYDGLVDLGYEKHFRVNHGNDEFSKGGGNHINGIESFWGYAKHRLAKFKGIPKEKFVFHLKETEFRFNHRGLDLYKIFLKIFRENPI